MKVCADIISSPQVSSLKINVVPRCVNFITGTEKIVIAVKSTNDHIDALVDHQLFSIIHYVKEAPSIFYALYAANVTVFARVYDENVADVEVSPFRDIIVSKTIKHDFLLLKFLSKPLFPVTVICIVEHADVYWLKVANKSNLGKFSGRGLQHTVYNDSTWEKPIKIQISLRPSSILPPLSSKLTLSFESRGDLRYKALNNIEKHIHWQSPAPEVKSVSVTSHDATLLKIRWSAPGTHWANNSLFYLKIETTSPNEKAESEVWHIRTTDNYMLSSNIWTEETTVRLKAPLYMVQPTLRMKYSGQTEWGELYEWKNRKNGVPVLMASMCDSEYYLNVSSLNPENWKCQKCPIDDVTGVTQFNCRGCRTWEDVALRQGFWRPNKSHFSFYPCLDRDACLGEKPGKDFDLGRYKENAFEWEFLKKFSSCFSSAHTLNNLSGLIEEWEETCNEIAGYKKLCNVGGKNGAAVCAQPASKVTSDSVQCAKNVM